MHLKSNSTPSAAPGGHVWDDEDSIVEVPDQLGVELLRIAGQFSEVLPGHLGHPDYIEDDLIGAEIPPPKTGPKASRDLWEKYAEGHGIETEGLTRDEIIQALAEAGKPVDPPTSE